MNPFDQGLNGYPGEGLGFIKKIKKAVKRVTKEVKRSSKKVVAEVKRSDIAKVALVGAVAMFAGPAVGALMKSGAGAAAKAGAIKAGGVAMKVGGVALKGASTVSTIMQATAKNSGAPGAVVEQVGQSGAAIDAQIARIASDPAYAKIVQDLRAQGYTDAQIVQAWAESGAAQRTIMPVIEETIYPQVYSGFVQNGYPPQVAESLAVETSHDMAQTAVQQAKAKLGVADWLKIGLPVAAIALTLLNK